MRAFTLTNTYSLLATVNKTEMFTSEGVGFLLSHEIVAYGELVTIN